MHECDDPRCEGVDKVMEKIDKEIKGGRWGALYSPANPPFCYTVGLDFRGATELIVTGPLPMLTACTLLNTAGDILLKNKQRRFALNLPYLGIATTNVRFVEVKEEFKREYMAMAFNFYGNWDFDVQQMVWPDPDGNYPWDDKSQFLEGGIFHKQQPIFNEIGL